MKSFINDLIPRLVRFSQKLDNETLLMNQHWIIFNESNTSKIKYIFRQNNQLLVSTDGVVDEGTWDYVDKHTLYIKKSDGNFLLKHGFFDDTVLALKVDGANLYHVMVNEGKSGQEFTSIDQVAYYLESKYLQQVSHKPDQLYSQPKVTTRKRVSTTYTDSVLRTNEMELIRSELANIKTHIDETDQIMCIHIVLDFAKGGNIESKFRNKYPRIVEMIMDGTIRYTPFLNVYERLKVLGTPIKKFESEVIGLLKT